MHCVTVRDGHCVPMDENNFAFSLVRVERTNTRTLKCGDREIMLSAYVRKPEISKCKIENLIDYLLALYGKKEFKNKKMSRVAHKLGRNRK